MRAIVIDPKEKEISEVEIDGSLESLQKIVGGNIETAVRFNNEDVMFVNEEGLFAEEKHWFMLKDKETFHTGCAVIVGREGKSGNAQSELRTITELVDWKTDEEALEATGYDRFI